MELALIALIALIYPAAVLYLRWYKRTVSTEEAVVVSHGNPTRTKVSLDIPMTEAVAVLVRDGWKRSAALSALASTGWAGYPDVPSMVLSAWKSMPGYVK